MIPEGYGAGVVMLWDKGTWTPESPDVDAALRKGDLKFTLDGYKLKGSWVLVRTRGYGDSSKPSWLLIKHKDEWAGPIDITEFAPLSVKTPDADFADILAADTPALWHSNPPAKTGDTGKLFQRIIATALELRESKHAGEPTRLMSAAKAAERLADLGAPPAGRRRRRRAAKKPARDREEALEEDWSCPMTPARTPLSRRAFVGTGALAAAHVWIPGPAKGYTAAEAARAVENGVGISKWDLDTPALCVDLDALESNIATHAGAAEAQRPRARGRTPRRTSAPPSPSCRWPPARIGICTAKVSEAEALFAHGIDRICMTTSNPSASKIRRAMALRSEVAASSSRPSTTQPNARDLSAAAKEAGVTADVVIDVAVGTRSGIPAGDDALALAKLVDTLPNLRLRGLLSYDGGAQHINGFAARKAQTLENIEANAEVVRGDERPG